MKYIISLIFFFGIAAKILAQEVKSYSFEELNASIRDASQEQFLVVNFWATWCRPCIKELPYFESLSEDLNNKDVRVMLVSLDMEKEKAAEYARKKDLQSEILYLDEVDFNQWIDSISPDWSGAIPATLLVAPGGDRLFYEGSFEQKELVTTVERFIQKNP